MYKLRITALVIECIFFVSHIAAIGTLEFLSLPLIIINITSTQCSKITLFRRFLGGERVCLIGKLDIHCNLIAIIQLVLAMS